MATYNWDNDSVALDDGDLGLEWIEGVGFRPVDKIEIYGGKGCVSVMWKHPVEWHVIVKDEIVPLKGCEKWTPPPSLFEPPIYAAPPVFFPPVVVANPPYYNTPPVWFPPYWDCCTTYYDPPFCCTTHNPPHEPPPPPPPDVVPLPPAFILLVGALFLLKRIAS